MSEWKEYTLADVTSVLGDGLHGTPKYQDDGPVFFINGNNLENGIISIKETTKRVSEEEAQKYKKPLNDRTLMVSINGTIGNVAKYNGEPCILGKSACYFNVKEEFDKDFIYYVVCNPNFVTTINQLATGTTIKNVSLKTMREYSFFAPSLEKQQKIASILSSLDSKIAINRKINENLEQQAQALFKSWFVDFEPFKNGKFVESELGLIPEGWKVVSLGEICAKITDGSHYSPKDNPNADIPMLSVKDMEEFSFDYSKSKHIDEKEYQKMVSGDCVPKTNDILVAKDGSYLKNIFICKKEIKQAILSSIAIFRPNSSVMLPSILLSLLKNGRTRKDVSDNYVSGSALPRIVLKDFKKYKTIVPPIEVQERLGELIESYYSQIQNNVDEIQSLSSLRDTLLPRLMSGELNLED